MSKAEIRKLVDEIRLAIIELEEEGTVRIEGRTVSLVEEEEGL